MGVNTAKLLVAMLLMLVAVYGINIAATTGMLISIGEKLDAQKPAELRLISLSDSSCPSCFDTGPLADFLKKAESAEIASEEAIDFSSQRGKDLAASMGIRKIPTLIVLGDTGNEKAKSLWENGWKQGGEGVFFENPLPPYRDLASGEVKGLVKLTEITGCRECYSFSQLVASLEKQARVVFSEKRSIDFPSEEGKALVKKLSLKKVPALVLSDDIKEYPQLKGFLGQVNAMENGGSLSIESLSPPYMDLSTNEVKGLVTVIYLGDSSCQDCYDVSVNKQILEQLGIFLKEEKTLDINSQEGKALIEKYSITKVPIILLSEDAKEYPGFSQAWPQVGSLEKDGWYVMRDPSSLGKFMDLV